MSARSRGAWEGHFEVVEVRSWRPGPIDDDQARQAQDLVGRAPLRELRQDVGPDDEEQLGPAVRRLELLQEIDRVRRRRTIDVQPRQREQRVVSDGQDDHRTAVLGLAAGRALFQRILSGRQEQDAFELESPRHLLGGEQMAIVRGVEGAAQQPQPLHSTEVPPRTSRPISLPRMSA